MGKVKLVFETSYHLRKRIGMMQVVFGLITAAIAIGYFVTLGPKALSIFAAVTSLSMLLMGSLLLRDE